MIKYLDLLKERVGIPTEVTVYDRDIALYYEDCLDDMCSSGVPAQYLEDPQKHPQVLTAVSLYVKAYLGNDRTDTELYLDLYRKKVSRLALEGD